MFSSSGEFLARRYVNQHSQITCRILTSQDIPIASLVFSHRIEQALSFRRKRIASTTNAFRLINFEGDFLPGLLVDVYEHGLVCQFLTAGMEVQKERIIPILQEHFQPTFIYERSDSSRRMEEGLTPIRSLLQGELPDQVLITENGIRVKIDVSAGQKTGFFLDQRENRLLFRQFAEGLEVCDCFCYSSGFALQAARAHARTITAVDQSRRALELLEENFLLNHFTTANLTLVQESVFTFLREKNRLFALIVLDPPSFAKNKSAVKDAARGYKELNLQALKCLRKGGILFPFPCSQFIDHKLFQQIVFSAAAAPGKEVQTLRYLSHAPDHPVSLYHPEGNYLLGLVLRIGE